MIFHLLGTLLALAPAEASELSRVCHPSAKAIASVMSTDAGVAPELVVSDQSRLSQGELKHQAARQAALLKLLADPKTSIRIQASAREFELAQAVRESGAILLASPALGEFCIEIITGRIAWRTMRTSTDE